MTNREYVEDTEIYINHFCQEEVPLPTLAMIEISSRCNLSCVMCPRSLGKSPTGRSGDISLEAFDRLEGLLSHLDSVVLSWIGEPLLHPQFNQILQRVKARKAKVHVTTNGMLIDDELAVLLVRQRLDGLAVSIDAADEVLYRRIRQGGDLARVKENIRRIQRAKNKYRSKLPYIQIACVVSPENADQLPTIVRLAQELGVRRVTFSLIDDFGLTTEYDLAHRDFRAAKIGHYFQEAKHLAAKWDFILEIECRERFFHEIGLCGGEVVSLPRRRVQRNIGDVAAQGELDDLFFATLNRDETRKLGFRKGCAIPWMHTFISHEGDVHPCCIADVLMGNIYRQPFEEIWRGEAYQDFRRKLKSTAPPDICWRCRRAIWNGSQIRSELQDAMVVGGQEVHGLGWKEKRIDSQGTPFRLIARQATAFLHNTGKRTLSLEVGTFIAKVITGRVLVNDSLVGHIRIRPGWQTMYLPLPPLEGDVLKVKLLTDYRDASVAVRRIALADQLVESPLHRAGMRSALFKALLDAWRVGGLYARHGAKVILDQWRSLLDRP